MSHHGEVTYEIHVDGRRTMSRRSPAPGIPAAMRGPGPYSVEAGGEIAWGAPPEDTGA